MKVSVTQNQQALAADPALQKEGTQVRKTDLLAANSQTSPASKMQTSPELRIARGGDSLEISSAGRALLEESLKQRSNPLAAAKAAQQDAAEGKASEEKSAADVPSLLVAKK
jgi:hypothetical protein